MKTTAQEIIADTHTLTLGEIQEVTETQRKHIMESLLDESDTIVIHGKRYINKKGYRKIALSLGINTEVIREERIKEDDTLIYDFTVRASTNLGRYVEASASCSSQERDFNHLQNDVRTTSQTRATNRAISDLIWIAEVSLQNETPSVTKSETRENTEEEMITAKQRYLLIKLIEKAYQAEQTRSDLYKSIAHMSKKKARLMIRDLLDEVGEI